MTNVTAASTGWRDLLAEGRFSRFALICLGVWLNAADALVTATIMPSVGADLGGYAYFSWAVAGFLVGAILAGASAGRLAEIFGLRQASALAGVACMIGCAMSAAAPNVGVFLAGRLVQGTSCGWISGFSMVAIALLFPERHLARVFASVSGVWGVATVLGPLVGGIFAEAGAWRGVFWLFAVQAGLFSLAALWLLRGSGRAAQRSGVPWLQLGVLTVGVAAIALADVIHVFWMALALVAVGVAILGLVLWIDNRARVRLLPRRAGDLRTVVGAGYSAMFWMTAASMGFAIYGPPILQTLRGLSPLWAGYVIGVESIAWTIAAVAVASAGEKWDAIWVRTGGVMLVASLVILTWAMAGGPLWVVLVGGALLGAAFGLSWSFMTRRIMAVLSDEDRAIGTSATIAIRQTGAAAGAAISGAAANIVGFSTGLTTQSAQAAAIWVFASVIPVGLIGAWAAFRLTGKAARP
ncbi:MFS transporter [Phenylobacterium deserti]|uniref:MFS transporter n=1 Tax=Phenylobacterium deserti TaxID=1914756 RepID=A0A328APW7_9CAUL|nr:MFS transporter [Phenylobacterium deserti]RAK56637.1 MFS transporter [Phenylobacterium deserti]